MADVVLVSQSNLEILLKALKSEFLTQLSNVTVFTDAGIKIGILDIIQTTGDGSNILADNGTYINAKTVEMSDVTTKTNQVWSLFNMTQNVNGYYYPNIPEYLPILTEAETKTANISIIGDGTRFLNDAGVYVDVKIYKGLTETELSTLCTNIIGGIL